MRYMMLMLPGAKAETDGLPDPQAIATMMSYNEELQKAGVLLALEGLQPSAKGVRVAKVAGKRTVTDGPFSEARELVGGFWMIQVRSKEEAVAWASRCPLSDGETIELRLVYEMSDFTNIDAELAASAEALGKALPGA
jgi:hypothetical protein